MEYTQERLTTLHQLTDQAVGFDGLEGILEETAIVVPMTDREHERPAAEAVLSALETLQPSPAAVVVPVRASADRIEPFRTWLESFHLPTQVLWCTAPGVNRLLSTAGLDGDRGKGRDIWLALGPATRDAKYVVVHDADATSYRADHVARLLSPLSMGYAFSKGYYARVEDDRLYGRLCRLLYEPLIETLSSAHDEPILEYFAAFRYALAGEVAMTASLARSLRPPRTWGLEVATLGDAYDYAGFDGSAQVDLGIHQHDHRDVDGETGLEGMSRDVAGSLLGVLENGGVDVDYETLQERYCAAADRLIGQYRADAAFNGLTYDVADERAQINRYAKSLEPPEHRERLPPWSERPLEPAAVVEAATPWATAVSTPETASYE
ncbi:glycosyl transferase family 2 [Natronosalvus vescus]|uniref:glycosyl transferase family 2 n=1 Tax=Natronosalvus vescus TaxID=2953881 RepID=UPI002091773C|nr:glycosyl transferase family 2 [Natronosalvus vescus]